MRFDIGDLVAAAARSVQRTGGKIVTVYYFHDDSQGDRYLAATIWNSR